MTRGVDDLRADLAEAANSAAELVRLGKERRDTERPLRLAGEAVIGRLGHVRDREAYHDSHEVAMDLAEYIILFVLVVTTGGGIPGPGDAAMIAAGTLAGEGRLNIGVVLVTSIVAWMLGSLAGYEVGLRGGRALLDHPGRLEQHRRKLLAKGDKAFGRHNFTASVTLPAYVSGIFRVRLVVFVLGALVSGAFFVGLYEGLSYLFGEEVVRRIGDAGAKALLGVLVAVAIGLGIRFGWSKWRAARRERSAGTSAVREGHASSVAQPRRDGRGP